MTTPPRRLSEAQIEENLARYRTHVMETIARVGWCVILTAFDGPVGQRAIGYTVGLTTTFGHPELAMGGLSHQLLHDLLNDAAQRVRDGERFEHGARSDTLVANFPVELRTIPDRTLTHFTVARWWLSTHEQPLHMCQVVFPDADGHFPWETGYASMMRAAQPDWWVAPTLQ
jgi:hypothetical protein